MARQIELGFLRYWRGMARCREEIDEPAPTCGEAFRAWNAFYSAEPWQPGRINPNRYRKD